MELIRRHRAQRSFRSAMDALNLAALASEPGASPARRKKALRAVESARAGLATPHAHRAHGRPKRR